jgi:uncharacterized protein YkwD
MRRGALSVCAVVLCAFIAAPAAAPGSVAESRATSTTRDSALIVAVNSARALHLLPKLRLDLRLARAARFHSRDMLLRDYFGHGDLLGRMLQFHVRGRVFAENLAWGSGIMSANATVASWLASPPHRTVLLDPKVRRIGVATPLGAFASFSRATVITADFAGG